MELFDPSGEPRAFRAALGRFATGVTVITTNSESGPVGITANSFASVSLDPPLVLWSPAKNSSRFALFASAPYFAIHVLGQDQFALAQGFAQKAQSFGGVAWEWSERDVPLIAGCLARFECRLAATHDAGDHLILIGHVERAGSESGTPLMFHDGRYLSDLPSGMG